jgi:hypothetical protein
MPALVALLAAIVYANSLNNRFAFDDVGIVEKNPHVIDLQWTAIWHSNYWPTVEGVQPDALYRPLTLWTYLANQAIAPGVAWPFHLVNVLLHCLVTVLMMALAWRILGDRLVAIIAGILFAVHPLHTEVVANVVGRAELLAASWSLLMLLIFLPSRPIAGAPAPAVSARTPLIQSGVIALATVAGIAARWMAVPNRTIAVVEGAALGIAAGLLLALLIGALRKSDQPQGVRPWWHGLLVAACFVLGLLCKETPVTLTLAVVLIDVWRFFQWRKESRPSIWAWLSTQAVRYYAPLALAVVCYTRARIHAGGLMSRAEMVHRVVNPLIEAAPLERAVTPFMLLAKYILLTLWPVHLSADYSAPSLIPTANPFMGNAFQPPAIFGMLICVLLAVLSIHLWKRKPQFLLLSGFCLLSYMLVANVVRIGTIFGERLFYWPSVFVLIILAWGAAEFGRYCLTARTRQLSPLFFRAVWGTIFVGAVALMSARTIVRNPDWADNISLAISTARDNTNSGKACSWAGSILLASDNPAYHDFGRQLVERAVELSPDFVSARWELAKYYGLRGQLGPSAVCVAAAARFDPGTHMTRTAIPALIDDMRKADPATYMPYIEAYQKQHPGDAAAYFALSFAYHAQGNWAKAEELAYTAFHTAGSTKPNGIDAFHEAGAQLAAIRFDSGDVEKAVITMRKYCLQGVPNSVDGRCTFVTMLLALDPKTNPDAVKEAEANVAIAEDITPSNPRVRETRSLLLRYKAAVARGLPMPADLPAPRITVAEEPKTGVQP